MGGQSSLGPDAVLKLTPDLEPDFGFRIWRCFLILASGLPRYSWRLSCERRRWCRLAGKTGWQSWSSSALLLSLAPVIRTCTMARDWRGGGDGDAAEATGQWEDEASCGAEAVVVEPSPPCCSLELRIRIPSAALVSWWRCLADDCWRQLAPSRARSRHNLVPSRQLRGRGRP